MSDKGEGGQGQPVIILGAGMGRRFGSPKLLARHEGQSFLERILTRCSESGARPVLVSDPRHREAIDALLATLLPKLLAPFPRIIDGDGEAPMLASVQAALRQGPYLPGWWLWPVDAPFISSSGWRRAVAAVASDPEHVWKLRAGGRTGHPIWFPAWSAESILVGDWPDGLRGYLATLPPESLRILVMEGELMHDIDYQGQLDTLKS